MFLLIAACNSTDQIETPVLFEELNADSTGVAFTNQIQESNVANILTYQYFYNGGGVAVGDINNDGLEDLYFTGNQVSNKLFLNLGNLKFRDITLATGTGGRTNSWTTGAVFVDINSDGLLDIYVCNSGDLEESQRRNQLFVNQGLDTKEIPFYKEMAADFGLDDPAFSTSAYFFDFDLDGDLDLLLLNHNPLIFNNLNINAFRKMLSEVDPFSMTKLYENQDGKFKDISIKSGLSGTTLSYALGAGIGDFNQDGWPDFYLGNDYSAPDYLYINQGDGTFKNEIQSSMGHTSLYTMGVEVVDINQDGALDIFSLDMLPEDNRRQKLLFSPENYEHYQLFLDAGLHHQLMRNMLQINQGNGNFAELGQLAGISTTDWSWSALFADFDNDGSQDLFVSNGFLKDFTNLDFINYRNDVLQNGKLASQDLIQLIEKMPATKLGNYAFRNKKDFKFEDVSEQWGLNTPQNSNGAAYADLDLDGDLDLILNNLNEPSVIYKNLESDSKNSNYLQIKLIGEEENPFGVGTKVRVYSNGTMQFQEQTIYKGFQGNVSGILHFGLGNQEVDSIQVVWPRGAAQSIIGPSINQLLDVKYSNASLTKDNSKPSTPKPFYELVHSISFEDEKSRVNDFKSQSQLLYSLSDRAPAMVAGDINGDGLKELLLVGSQDQLFAIQSTGEQERLLIPTCMKGIRSMSLADIDLDGDLDLYLAKGGISVNSEDSNCLQDIVLINDGKGNFNLPGVDVIPQSLLSSSIVNYLDINNDGLLDFFVGGDYLSGEWPNSSGSRILLNRGDGKFEEWQESAEILNSIQRVTDVRVVDLDSNGSFELVVASEFSTIRIFEWKENQLLEISEQVLPDAKKGLWRSLWIGKLGNVNEPFLIAGNWGLNSRIQADPDFPIQYYVNDFDQNGSVDPLMFQNIGGRQHPFFSRDELSAQLYRKKALFKDYESFAEAVLEDVLTIEELVKAELLEVESLSSSIFQYDSGRFKEIEVPVEFQYSPINAIVPGPVENEIIIVGNLENPRLKIGKLDANQGLILHYDPIRNEFKSVPAKETGFDFQEQLNSAVWNEDFLWVYSQNSKLYSFKNRLE